MPDRVQDGILIKRLHGDLEPITILLIDDDPLRIATIKTILQYLNYNFMTAESGLEGIEKYRKSDSVKVVLISYSLQDMDGINVLTEIKRLGLNRPSSRSILIADSPDFSLAREAMRAGAFDIISLPVMAGDIAASMREAIRSTEHELITEEAAHSHLENERSFIEDGAADVSGKKNVRHKALSPHVENGSDILELLRLVYQERHRAFGADFFGDPAWEIVLELVRMKVAGKKIPVTSACTGTNASLTTGLRWIRRLEDNRMIVRHNDPEDRRRELIELSPDFMAKIMSVLEDTKARFLSNRK